jgi:hypothetical protein
MLEARCLINISVLKKNLNAFIKNAIHLQVTGDSYWFVHGQVFWITSR